MFLFVLYIRANLRYNMIMNKETIIKIIKNEWTILSFIIALALSLRLVNLGIEPYWGDEVLSLDIVKHYQGDLAGMIHYLKEIEIHPPLYYIMLKFWSGLFGYGELAIKSLSVVFGLGVVWLSFYAGRIFYPGTKFGLLAALLAAILPMQIEFSQEARPYVIFCFFGLLSIISLWQFLETKSKKQLAIFILSSIVGLYLHYSFLFILFAALTWWLGYLIVEKKYNSREMVYFLGSGLAVFLGFYYWFTAFLYKLALSDVTLFLSNAFSDGALRTSDYSRNSDFFNSTLNQLLWLTAERKISSIEILAVIIFKLAFFFFIVYWLKANKEKASVFFQAEGKKISYFLWLAVAPMILFLFSPQSFPYAPLVEKHIIISSIMAVFVIAALLIRLKPKEMALLLTIFIVSVATFDIKIMRDDSLWDDDHRLKIVAEYINENYKEGDLVVTYFGFGRTDFNHFLIPSISAAAIYPIFPFDWEKDYLASRDTLGFMENEAQLRVLEPTKQEVDLKINYLLKKNKPNRVWVYGDDKTMNNWFREHNWRYAIKSLGPLFPVNLYVKK